MFPFLNFDCDLLQGSWRRNTTSVVHLGTYLCLVLWKYWLPDHRSFQQLGHFFLFVWYWPIVVCSCTLLMYGWLLRAVFSFQRRRYVAVVSVLVFHVYVMAAVTHILTSLIIDILLFLQMMSLEKTDVLVAFVTCDFSSSFEILCFL